MNNFSQCNSTSARLVLRNVEADSADGRVLKWTLDLRHDDSSLVVVARSTRSGLVTDLQQLGGVEREWPARTVETIAERIAEELARARIATVLASVEARCKRGERAA
jgi:hypothetical protein